MREETMPMTERIRHTDRTISRMTAEERWASREDAMTDRIHLAYCDK